jgi:OOP family OmpA-OmpF porin
MEKLIIVLAGILALLGLGWLVVQPTATQVENDLLATSMAAVDAAGLNWVKLSFDGQKAIIEGGAPNAEAQQRARAVVLGAAGRGGPIFGGVVAVEDRSTVGIAPAAAVWRALAASGKIELSGRVANAEVRATLVDHARRLFGDQVVDRTEIGGGPGDPGWLRVAGLGLDVLGSLQRGEVELTERRLRVVGVAADQAGAAAVDATLAAAPKDFRTSVQITTAAPAVRVEPTPAAAMRPAPAAAQAPAVGTECQREVDALLARATIRFAPGSAEIDRSSIPLIDSLAQVLRRCPQVRVRIGGHTDSLGQEAANQDLSLRRARNVRENLGNAGIPRERMVTVGFGSSRPIASNATEDGRASNRRISFEIIE